MGRKLTDKQEKELCEKYVNGISSTILAKEYSINRTTVVDIVKRNNYQVKLPNNISPYHFNEHWLDNLNAPEKLYFLGIMYADGCNERTNKVSLSLKESDKQLLLDISKAIDSDRPLTVYDAPHKANEKHEILKKLYFTSEYFSNKLLELGCVYKKSLILKWPDWLEGNEYFWSFIRGCFDGDGSISIKKNKNGEYNALLTYTGSIDFCNGLRNFLEKNNIKTKFKIKNNHEEVYITSLKNCKLFLDNIYKEKSLYLKRKYILAETFLNSRDFSKETLRDKRNIIINDTSIIIERYMKGESSNKIAKSYNCGGEVILRVLKKNNIPLHKEINKLKIQ